MDHIDILINEALKIANEAIENARKKDPATVREVLLCGDMCDIALLLERAERVVA